jgi:large subunit ribosomal protein LP2
MKHLAAYLLLQQGGNDSPSAKDIKAVLESVGIEADDDRLKTLLAELKGKDINEVFRQKLHDKHELHDQLIFWQLITEGSAKLASVPSGGAASGGGGGGAAAGGSGAAAEEAKEEEKEEEKEESDDDMGFGLFD